MIINNINKRKSGFTLMELLIYIAGLLALGTVLTMILIQFYGLYREIISVPRADRVGLSLVDRITREIRSAKEIDNINSQFGTVNGVLDFNSVEGEDTVEKRFYVQNGVVKYSENLDDVNSSTQNITPSDLFVSNFNFTPVNSTSSEAIRFNLEIQFERMDGIETKSYTGFAILRESYE